MSALDHPADADRPLAAFQGLQPPPEPWMARALAHPGERTTFTVQGADLELYTWGEVGRPGLLFIHGGMAHARWWDFVIPFFADTHRCAAMSLGGMGQSGWRDVYAHEIYAAEAAAAMGAAALDAATIRPVVIGHSFGGLVAVQALERHGDMLAGGVVIDSPLIPLERRLKQDRGRVRSHTVYTSPERAIERFRLVPDERQAHPFLLDHAARHGLAAGDNGCQWSFDPNGWNRMDPHRGHPDFGAVAGRIAFIRGEGSTVVGDDSARALREVLGGASPFIEIPNGGHHILLNEPLALVATLRTLLQAWPALTRSA